MVAPKYKAIELGYRPDVVEALQEIGRLRPNVEKIKLLINLFNEVHGTDIFTLHKYMGCGDCQRNLKNFWTYVIAEWNSK